MSYKYDNQTPEDFYPTEPSEKQMEAYRDTAEFQDWMMENAGNGDWVAYEERNCDLITEMACEWLDQNYQAAEEEKAEAQMEKRSMMGDE